MREHLPAVFPSMRVISHICLRMAFSSHGTLVSVPLCGVGLRQVWLVDPVVFSTRQETRTKESSACASSRVASLKAE